MAPLVALERSMFFISCLVATFAFSVSTIAGIMVIYPRELSYITFTPLLIRIIRSAPFFDLFELCLAPELLHDFVSLSFTLRSNFLAQRPSLWGFCLPLWVRVLGSWRASIEAYWQLILGLSLILIYMISWVLRHCVMIILIPLWSFVLVPGLVPTRPMILLM